MSCRCPQHNTDPGEVAEWSNAAVLKTVGPKGPGGSNPSLSAISMQKGHTWPLFAWISPGGFEPPEVQAGSSPTAGTARTGCFPSWHSRSRRTEGTLKPPPLTAFQVQTAVQEDRREAASCGQNPFAVLRGQVRATGSGLRCQCGHMYKPAPTLRLRFDIVRSSVVRDRTGLGETSPSAQCKPHDVSERKNSDVLQHIHRTELLQYFRP